jgi:N-acyl-D-amino-acid deacylase
MSAADGTMSIVIRNADVLDGTGAPAFRADIGLVGDRIAAIGDLSTATVNMAIDGTGLTAAPGFIDMHSHSDFTLPINPRAESKVRQGVTTEVIGQCGDSTAPLNPTTRELARAAHPHLPWDWTSFGEYLDHLRRQGLAVNVVPLVGHGTIRSTSMGLDDRVPTASEMEAMKRLVIQAMDEGAWGISTGLIYAPGLYASTDELVELAGVVAERGGFYSSHIRGEGTRLLKAVGEAIEIGERAGVPVQIAHLKASKPKNWSLLPQALRLIDDARARGLDVAADRYPYTASSTSLSAQLPPWVHDGGSTALLDRLRSPETRRRILAGARARQWDRILIAHSPGCPEIENLTIAEIADQRGTAPDETVLDILLETEARVSVIHFGMKEENLHTVLRHPAVMIGSDGSARTPTGPLGEGKSHPRSYGTFPRVLGKYAREESVLSLPEAIRKMSRLPAERLGLSDRGRLAKGMKADVVLFNPDTVRDRATYTEPYQYPVGIEYVFVNGQVVVGPEGHTGALPGRILNR